MSIDIINKGEIKTLYTINSSKRISIQPIMDGSKKYIYRYDLETSYLYNLKKDIGEKDNVIHKNKKEANRLKSLLTTYLKEVNALYPKENPNYKKEVKYSDKNISSPLK